ncbi:UNKNOWN [Stylonychia lemnae]|uniref:Leucine rich repeat family protein n=1 Tax=Stylonychia lemnae TaxID=5949 RepID=A0A078BBQ9_STYLE|nr:UNKNOWN [Stylonychia lemnae]|eukprot:CDW91018.1 UNKNOWN [Stylonychia lemnae]
MNQELIKSLGLFVLPPTFIKKTQEQKKQEQLIQSQYKDFFNDGEKKDEEMELDDDEKLKRQKEKELEEQEKKREQHLIQLDATKKLYINEMMRRSNMFDVRNYILDFDMTEQEKQQIQLNQDKTYFKKLQDATKIEFDTQVVNNFATRRQQTQSVIKKLQISEFCVRIGFVDKILKNYKTPIMELTLNSTFITASECMVLASNPRARELKSLDLSCNPISVQGLLYLISPKTSAIQKLQKLTLINCDIDQSQTYMVSNDRLENGKCTFYLRYLNLSHNSLNLFLNYVTELDLINTELESLQLVNCDITDEQILNLIQSNKLSRLEHLDLCSNHIEKTFPLMMKWLKENCDYLQNVFINDNKQMKNSQTMQISKGKKSSGLPLLAKLDLSRSLRGDLHANQLSQSSYLKDLRYLNLRDCKICQKGFDDIIQSQQLRSLECLIMRKNRVRNIEGPYGDLEDIDEKNIKKGVIQLKLLDLRENKLTKIFMRNAIRFLKETVVLMWDNPFDNMGDLRKEYYDPACLFRASIELEDDPSLIQNPLHIFQVTERLREMFENI